MKSIAKRLIEEYNKTSKGEDGFCGRCKLKIRLRQHLETCEAILKELRYGDRIFIEVWLESEIKLIKESGLI